MIPFTQYLRPDGRQHSIQIEMPPPIEHLAIQFMKAGGRYEAEVLRTGEVSLTAVFAIEGERQDIAIEVCPNGTDVPIAVEKLVRRSISFLDKI